MSKEVTLAYTCDVSGRPPHVSKGRWEETCRTRQHKLSQLRTATRCPAPGLGAARDASQMLKGSTHVLLLSPQRFIHLFKDMKVNIALTWVPTLKKEMHSDFHDVS